MRIESLLPSLSEPPRDARGAAATRDVHQADEVIYRLGLGCLPVPGLPADTSIDDVYVEFVRGPVRAQHTEMRQRHGLPVIFDKHMTRTEFGENEMVAVFSIREAPVPADFDPAFGRWRARALAAAGLLSAVLDERIAADELFEDAVLLSRGVYVGAADMRGLVRTYMPFEVSAERIWLSDEKLSGFDDLESPGVLVNLVWDLHGLVGAATAQQGGLASEGPGVAAVEAVGSYAQYRRLIVHGEFDAELLQIPRDEDALSVGKIAGWAAAGDTRAARRLRALTGRNRKLAEAITEGLAEAHGPPEHVLELGNRAAREAGLPPEP